ncbi:MAG: CoA transferase [Oscillospiraceae bacterium]|nr:CoA transferase [Oscillospiraceae bacterium]
MARALSGVKVVELATFVAAACAARFFGDQGADVIKVESLQGDGIRFAALAEGRPDLPDENVVFEVENANKRGIALDLKDPRCYEAFMKLLADADILITNWRPKALEKLGLDYETLSKKFPKLVYGSVTGYGDKGPDKDLPGFDYTAYWTRSGILGSLYEKGTVPMNLIPAMGDRQVGMALAAGLLAALFNAQRTGKGEKVSVSLLGTAIFSQATMIQTAQYGTLEYPLTKRTSPHPLNNNFKTKDGRFVQLSMPMFERMFPPFAKKLGREDWLTDPRFQDLNEMYFKGMNGVLYDEVQGEILKYDAVEFDKMMREIDIPCAIAAVWKEVLQDEQAWADDCFEEVEYPSGKRIMVRNPVHFQDAGLPDYVRAPHLGQHTAAVLKELGYDDEFVAGLIKDGRIITE